MKRIAPALAMVLAIAAAPAWSGEPEKGHDGCKLHKAGLTDAEFAKAQDEMFGKLDANADGSISREEFVAHHEEMRRKHREHAQHEAASAPDHEH